MTNAGGELQRIQRRTVPVLVLMQIIGMIGVGAAPSVGILLATEVTQNEAIAGLARSASTLGAALIGMPLGNLATARGRRTALTLGWFTAAVGAALLVFAAQFSLVLPLVLGLFAIGAGSAAGLQSRFAATDLAPDRAKARALALVVWVSTIGSVLGPNLGIPGGWLGDRLGLNVYAGAFGIGAVFLALAGVLVFIWMRPDPLLTLQYHTGSTRVREVRAPSIQQTIAEVRRNPRARYALAGILIAQVVMVAVMTMTPVHLQHHGDSITVIGLTISLHVAGMYVLAPVVGWAVDRFGHRVAVGLGVVQLAVSCTIAAFGQHDLPAVMVALVLLGTGWSFVYVAASALFSLAIEDEARASAQGGADALANLCAAVAAFVSGPLLAASDFAVLAVVSGALLLPLGWLTVRYRG